MSMFKSVIGVLKKIDDSINSFEEKVLPGGGVDARLDKVADITTEKTKEAAVKVADKAERSYSKAREATKIGLVECDICIGDEPDEEEGVEMDIHTNRVWHIMNVQLSDLRREAKAA